MDTPTHPEIPDFAALAADPEIAPLLEFEPVVRKVKRPDGWTPQLQRELIARIAATGTLQQAVWQMGKHATGAEALYKTPSATSFRKCWDAAIIIGRRRNGLDAQPPFIGEVPGITRRGKLLASAVGPLPGQVRNEHGEWEDEASFLARGEEAKDSIREKLLRCRRLFLAEISGSPGKRAAFEILTELPIDWEKAARLEPQPDEPWKSTNQRQPDMVLTAESGWTMGEHGYGPNRMADVCQALNEFLAEEGKPTVDWDEDDSESTENSEQPRQRHVSYSRDAKPVRPTTAEGASIDGAESKMTAKDNSLRDGAASGSLSPNAGEGGGEGADEDSPTSSSRTPIRDPATSAKKRSPSPSTKRRNKPGPRLRRV